MSKKKVRTIPVAFCWRTGEIGISGRPPAGCFPLGAGPRHALRRAIAGTARLARDNRTYLVPGVPEAASTTANLDAIWAYSTILTSRLHESQT